MKTGSKKQFHEAESTKLDPSSPGLSASGFQLNIGFDGKRAANNQTGLGNYSRFIIEQLALKYKENQYFVYTPKAKANIVKNSLFLLQNVVLKLPQKAKFLWRSLGIKKQLQEDNIDIFHGLSHEIPFGIHRTRIKSVVTIHDLIFLRRPAYYKFIDRKIYTWKSKYACVHANRIIAISECTKRDIMELYDIDPHKIDVVYQSCDDSFKTELSAAQKEIIAQKYQLPQKYMLNVGTIEARKNLLLLIEAMPAIDPSYQLVVVGKETPYFLQVKERMKELGITNRVIFLKNVPFADLPGIYQNAQLFVYPSFYEGFGIPIIEAIHSRLPVIAATGSCLEEAGGPESIYVDPTNSQALSTAILLVLENEQRRLAMIEKSLLHVAQFNNDIIAHEVMASYQKVLPHLI